MSVSIIEMSERDFEICNEELSSFRWRYIDFQPSGEPLLFSIYSEQHLVGYVHIILMKNAPDEVADGELYKIFIFPKYQKKGYGKKAAKLAIDWIYQNCDELYLEVVDDVIDFWDKILGGYSEQYSIRLKDPATSNTTKYIFSKN